MWSSVGPSLVLGVEYIIQAKAGSAHHWPSDWFMRDEHMTEVSPIRVNLKTLLLLECKLNKSRDLPYLSYFHCFHNI